MNPLTFKAHPLLTQWLEWLLTPSNHSVGFALHLALILLGSNLLWAAGLPLMLRKLENLRLSPIKTYWMALPATFIYEPLMLTLMEDVIHHAFLFSERWFLLLALLIGSQFLTAFYAFALRHPRSDVPIGIDSGLAVSMLLLLASMPAALILIGIHALAPFF